MDREALIHFVGGALGGTAGTSLTCPLEVIKTRMQSSDFCKPHSTDGTQPSTSSNSTTSTTSRAVRRIVPHTATNCVNGRPLLTSSSSASPWRIATANASTRSASSPSSAVFRGLLERRPLNCLQSRSNASNGVVGVRSSPGIYRYFVDIVKAEGFGALYKGLGPNLVGVAPSKAVYFYAYSSSKRVLNDVFIPNTAIVHMLSAGFAGFVAASVVNPIWLVKTRLQLHHGPMTIRQCVRRVHQRDGFRGFYRGVTASYIGISETIIQFVIYEHLRTLLIGEHGSESEEAKRSKVDFLHFMGAGGTAKLIASMLTYPHEVVRTRLREEGSKYRGFWRTLRIVYREGGVRGLYRGLSVQLLRTVPNTAITMGTYELVVYFLHRI